MSTVVHLSEELAARVEAVAVQRGLSADEVVAGALEAVLPHQGEDPLEAFIGSGASGRRQPFDIHEARAELAERKVAEGA
jgi:hypothetical protein